MGRVQYADVSGKNQRVFDYDHELSFKNFAGWNFKDRPEYDFTDKVIYSSVFTMNDPDTDSLPTKIAGATFVKCHLHNVVIPNNVTLVDCITTRCKQQNDLNMWEVNALNIPIAPLNKHIFVKLGLPIPNPADIPTRRVNEHVDLIAKAVDVKTKGEAPLGNSKSIGGVG